MDGGQVLDRVIGLAEFGAGLENILDGLRRVGRLVDAEAARKLLVGLAQIVLKNVQRRQELFVAGHLIR